MSADFKRSCIVREFPVSCREYRAAPPEHWDAPPPRRRPVPRRQKPRRLPLALLGLTLFAGGFLLGLRAAAAPAGSLSLPEERPAAMGAAASAAAAGAGSSQAAGGNGVYILGGSGSETSAPASPTTSGASPSAPASPGTSSSAEDWNLVLINGDHPLERDFQVPELTQLKNGHAIDSRAYPALQAMMDAARAAGYRPLICSSFRTWDKQAELFERKVQSCLPGASGREEAEALAAVWVARPGTSEHQAGLAVDIVDTDYQMLDQAQESRPVQQWLMAHCAEYGFILRYPTEKSAVTGVGYEPWHYRYVGTEAAQAITASGLCLEEYLAGLAQ